ncbi:MAG: DUF5995 family protein [Anaerolineaceae bacterium]
MTEKDQVLLRMNSLLESWEAARDQRLIFLSCYQMMTSNVLLAIQEQSFEDNVWVQTLMEKFAEVYFIALDQYEKKSDPPKVWKIAFEAPNFSQLHVIQNLVLGVNAHINYDLVFVLSELLGLEWQQLSEEYRQMRYRDHCHVNDIIFQTINSVQDQIIDRFDPSFEIVDKLLGPLDEWLTSKIISSWRENVWEHAVRLVDLADEQERLEFKQRVEEESVHKALEVLKFSRDADVIEKLIL